MDKKNVLLFGIGIIFFLIYYYSTDYRSIQRDKVPRLINKEKVSRINVYFPLEQRESNYSIAFNEDKMQWSFFQNEESEKIIAEKYRVNRIIDTFYSLDEVEFVTDYENSFETYQLTDGKLLKVQFLDDKSIRDTYTLGLVSGLFTYMKMDKKIYKTKSSLFTSINLGKEDFRSRIISDINLLDITSFSIIENGDTNKFIVQGDQEWTYEKESQRKLDISAITSFLQIMSHLTVDRFDLDKHKNSFRGKEFNREIRIETVSEKDLILKTYSSNEGDIVIVENRDEVLEVNEYGLIVIKTPVEEFFLVEKNSTEEEKNDE